MHIPTELQPRYRNRKGTLSQNILAVCNFDMQFVYILASWEGSAHDSRVLSDAQASQGFLTPKGKYWLSDTGYGNSEFVMALPYKLAYSTPLCGPCGTNALSQGGYYSKGIYYVRWSVRHTNFASTLR